MELGNQIKSLRLSKGLTQEALAEQLGVTAQAVSKWERNAALPDSGKGHCRSPLRHSGGDGPRSRSGISCVLQPGDHVGKRNADRTRLLTAQKSQDRLGPGSFGLFLHSGSLHTSTQAA